MGALGGGGDGDGVAECFELSQETASDRFGIAAALVAVGTEVGESFAGGEDVPDDVEETVGDGDSGLVRSSTMSDLTVLRPKVAALGACRRPGRFDEDSSQPPVAVGCADSATPSRRFVVPRAQSRPRREV